MPYYLHLHNPLRGQSLFWLLAVLLVMPLLAACDGTTTTTPPPPTTSPPPPAPFVAVDLLELSITTPTITVPLGTTVVWTSLYYNIHTVTSDTGLFDATLYPSEGEPTNASFSYTFTERGIFGYHCSIHLSEEMIGTVIVE